MSKLWKIAAGFFACCTALLVALLVLVKVFVTPERVKAVLLPVAEKALQRPVDLGNIRVGLFSGIELSELTISEHGEKEPFIAADRVVLRFQLLPLLARRVVIDEIALEHPVIRVIRQMDGSFSFSDLLTPDKAADPQEMAPKPGSEDHAFSLLVTSARISNGQLILIDRQSAASIELNGMQLEASGITLDGDVPIKLTAQLQGAPLQLDGNVRPLRKEGTFRINLQGLDALMFEPFFRGKVPGQLSRLLLDLQGEIDLQQSRIAAKGTVSGREMNLLLAALPAAPIQNARIKADYALVYDPQREHLDLSGLAIDYNGLVARFSGSVAALMTAPLADLRLEIADLELATLKNALPTGLLGKAGTFDLAGRVRLTADLHGPVSQPAQMIRNGEILLDKVQATAAGVRPSIDGRVTLSAGTARIESMQVRLGDIAAGVTGRVDRLFDAPTVDAAVTLPRTDLARALAAAPPDAVKGIAPLAPTGFVEATARLAGPLNKPAELLKSGELTLTGVQLAAGGQRPEFTGRLRLAGDQLVSEGLQVLLAGNAAALDVKARNLFGEPIVASVNVTARRFLLEPLLQGGGAAAAPAATPTTPDGAAAAVPGLPLQASGTLRIDEALWKGLTIREFVAEYALRDNQLTVGRMTGRAAGGSFSNTARVDLRTPELSYDTTLSLQGVQADTLIAALAPQATGTLFGVMTVQSSLNGRGTSWETISRTLSGEGTLTLNDGRLVSPALVQGLASVLQIADLRDIAFTDFRSRMRMVNGQAQVDSTLLGRQFKLYPKGTLGLDGSLNLTVDARLSPELAARIDQRGRITRHLLDGDGWTQVPLLLGGTLQSPKFGLDPKGVQAQAGRALQGELQRGLDKLLQKSQPPPAVPAGQEQPPPTGPDEAAAPPQPPPPAGAPEPANPAQKLLEESLKKVLGR